MVYIWFSRYIFLHRVTWCLDGAGNRWWWPGSARSWWRGCQRLTSCGAPPFFAGAWGAGRWRDGGSWWVTVGASVGVEARRLRRPALPRLPGDQRCRVLGGSPLRSGVTRSDGALATASSGGAAGRWLVARARVRGLSPPPFV